MQSDQRFARCSTGITVILAPAAGIATLKVMSASRRGDRPR